jgi:hypothetical protein
MQFYSINLNTIVMPTGKNKTKSKRTAPDKAPKGMDPWVVPGIPKARDRAKEIDEKRRGDAETFEL